MERFFGKKENGRRGSILFPSLFLGIFLLVGFYAWKTKNTFVVQTATIASKTFEDVFKIEQRKPVLEIDLRDRRENRVASLKEEKKTEPEKKIEKESAPLEKKIAKQEASVAAVAEETKPAPPVSCNFMGQGPTHAVLINEIAWMGGTKSASHEWIELRNNSGAAASLAGWQVRSEDENLDIKFGAGETIEPNGLYLLEKTSDEAVPEAKANRIYSGAILNSGMWIKLFDSTCHNIDEVNAASGWNLLGGENDSKQTLERNVKNFGWHTSVEAGGTPKRKNSEPEIKIVAPEQPEAPPPAPSAPPTSSELASRILISEVMVGSSASSSDEFIELYNPGDSEIDLTGWSIKKKAGASESTFVASDHFKGKKILPHKYFLIVNVEGYSRQVTADASWPKSKTLAYTDNSIMLYSTKEKVDEASWKEIPKGKSWRRESWTNNNFIVESLPTPQNSNQ